MTKKQLLIKSILLLLGHLKCTFHYNISAISNRIQMGAEFDTDNYS